MECYLNFSRIMKLNIILIILIIHQPFMWFVQGRGNNNNDHHNSNNNNNNNSNNNSDNNTNNNNSENNTSNNNHKNNNNHNHNSNNNNNNNYHNHDSVSSCTTVCVCKWKGGKQTVECIDRNLITIPDNIDQNTQVLDMSGNNLQILPHDIFIRAGLLNLQKLYLRNCRLGQINDDAFNGLTNLVELDLSNNILTNIPTSLTLQHIPSLRELTIALNPIQKIDSFAFKQTYSLTKLDLSHCDIRTIAPDAFKAIHSLHSLKLNGNKLSELRPRTIETLMKLHNIELHDNPWLCDCRLRATKLWLTQNNIPYPVQPICLGGPERIVNRTFAELLMDDFACKPELLPIPRFVQTTAGENATITCRTSAVPSATVNWYWNGRSLLNNSAFSSYQKIYLEESGEYDKSSRLVLTNAQEMDSSDFYCVAENRAGMVEANFTLHVGMRQAGMASLGSGQIVGISAALIIFIFFILMVILFLLIRLRHLPFTETKTPGHLEVVTATVSPQSNSINGGKSCSTTSTTNEYGLVQTGATTITTLTGAGTMTKLTTGTPTTSTTATLVTTSTLPLPGCSVGLMSSSSSPPLSIDRRQSNTDLKITNPLQKPPRLTDMSYTTSHYDGNGSILSSAAMYISPSAAPTMSSTITSLSRASSGNNPDLINDTKCFDGTIIGGGGGGILTTFDQQHLIDEQLRPGSGEYSRAGFDSLYPSGLWETHNISSVSPSSSSISTATTITAGTHNHNHNHQHHQAHPLFATMQSSTLVAQDLYLKRAASSTIPSNYDYTEKTPIISGSHHNLTNTNYDNNGDDDDDYIDNERLKSSIEYMSRTFPRTAVVAHQLVNNLNSNKINNNNNNTNINNNLNNTNDNNSNSKNNNNNNISINKNKNNISGYPSDYGLPIVPGAEQQYKRDQLLPSNGMPTNAKTLRVWQRGGVPVLPPVTALKRALTNSRNSPDEGYQEGCGTDV